MTHLPRDFTGTPVTWAQQPFGAPLTRIADPGMTVAEIVRSTPDLPALFSRIGIVAINDQLVPREHWDHVRPRQGVPGREIVVQLGLDFLGGGGGSGKTFRTIGMIALLVAAVAIGQFEVLGTLGSVAGPLGGAITGAKALAMGLSIAALALGALSKPPVRPQSPSLANGVETTSASLTGNNLDPGAPVPRCLGPIRVAPPFLARPFRYTIGKDQYVEAVYCLAGAHQLSDVKIGETPVGDIPDVEVELVEGRPGAPERLTLVGRQTFTDEPGIDLTRHSIQPDAQDTLLDQEHPEKSIPTWTMVSSRKNQDEVWITYAFSEGIADSSAYGTPFAVPLRLQIRKRGSAEWTRLPEIHVASTTGSPFFFTVQLIFRTAPLTQAAPPTAEGAYAAYKQVPGQTLFPPTGGWQADNYFSAGTGGDCYVASTQATHNVRNVSLYDDRAEIYLDPAVFVPGAWQAQTMQGIAYSLGVGGFSPTLYTYGDNVLDFFYFRQSDGKYVTARTRQNLRDRTTVAAVASIRNRSPATSENFAMIAIRAKGRSLGVLTVLGAGLVPTWNGTEWQGLEPSDNPADHFRWAYVMGSRKPAPLGRMDDADIIAWRAACVTLDYTINAVIEGRTVKEVAELCCGCGFAHVREGAEKIGVMMDRYTGAESPIKIFTPRNLTSFSWDKPLGNLPAGYRVPFLDAEDDYRQRELIVLRPGAIDDGNYEGARYEGFVTEAKVKRRAIFDLRQLTERMTFYSGGTGIEHIALRRGSLVGIAHDELRRQTGFARIASVMSFGGNLTGLELDATIPMPSEDAFSSAAAAWSAYSDAFADPRYGIAIRRKDGTVTTHEIERDAEEDKLIRFTTPFADPGADVIDRDCHIGSGPLTKEYTRLKVFGIAPHEDFSADIAFVDEGLALFNASDGSININ